MKKAVLFFFLGISTLAVYSQDKVAKIEFKEKTINLGKVAVGSEVKAAYEFTNTGDAPLVISDVKTGCGCTVSEKPNKPIAPGENGTIVVQYVRNQKPTDIRRSITVLSNAANAENNATVIHLRGELVDKIE